MNHLTENNVIDIFQYDYRKGHSRETGLLKVQNNILMDMDKYNAVLLVLLDISAAFNTQFYSKGYQHDVV